MSDTYATEVPPENGAPPAEELPPEDQPVVAPAGIRLSAPVQVTYPLTMAPAVAGMPATMTGWDADTRIVETVAGIGFGLAVTKGASGDRAIVVGGTAKFAGITYRDITQMPDLTSLDIYPRYSNAGVMVKGDIWVSVKAAVVAGTPANWDNATGQLGAAAGAGATAVPGAVWMTSQSSVNGLAILRLKSGPENA